MSLGGLYRGSPGMGGGSGKVEKVCREGNGDGQVATTGQDRRVEAGGPQNRETPRLVQAEDVRPLECRGGRSGGLRDGWLVDRATGGTGGDVRGERGGGEAGDVPGRVVVAGR